MSSMEFTYLQAAQRAAPNEQREADRRAALIAAAIANWSGYAKQAATIDGGIGAIEHSREKERQAERMRHAKKRRNNHR